MYESSNVYLLNRIRVFIVHRIMHLQLLVCFLHTVIISEDKITFQYFFSNFDSHSSLIIRHQVLRSNSSKNVYIYLTPTFLFKHVARLLETCTVISKIPVYILFSCLHVPIFYPKSKIVILVTILISSESYS